MNSLNTSIVVTLLSAAVLYPRPSSAMEIQMFDDVAIQDQQDYLKLLVNGAQKLLVEQGQRDLAKKVEQLFHKGSGAAEFAKHVADFRVFNREIDQYYPLERHQDTGAFERGVQGIARTFSPKRPLRTSASPSLEKPLD